MKGSLAILVSMLVHLPSAAAKEEITVDPWVGAYDVYKRNFKGEYVLMVKYDAKFTISKVEKGYFVKMGSSKLFREKRGTLVAESGVGRIALQPGEGAKVLEVSQSFQTLYLVDGDPPKRWIMEGEDVPIDPSLFEGLKSEPPSGALGADEIPAGLKRAYSKFVRWVRNDGFIHHLWLFESATFVPNRTVDVEGLRQDGAVIFLDEFRENFDPLTKRAIHIEGIYRFQTASSYLSWVETKAGEWRVFRHRNRWERDHK